jgi:hypothetical protein
VNVDTGVVSVVQTVNAGLPRQFGHYVDSDFRFHFVGSIWPDANSQTSIDVEYVVPIVDGDPCHGKGTGVTSVSENARTLNETASTVANFRLSVYHGLGIRATGSGSGTVGSQTVSNSPATCASDCEDVYKIDTVVQLSAVPAEGAIFKGFYGDPDCADGFVTITAETQCYAKFSFAFTDPGLQPNDAIKAIHLIELRSQTTAARLRLGLPSFNFTDLTLTPGVSTVKAVHFAELQAALRDAYGLTGQPLPQVLATDIVPGVLIRAKDVVDLRAALDDLS